MAVSGGPVRSNQHARTRGVLAAVITGLVLLAGTIAMAMSHNGSATSNRQILDTYTISQRTKDLDGRHIVVSTAQNPGPPQDEAPHTSSFSTETTPTSVETTPASVQYDEDEQPATTLVSKTVVMQHLQSEIDALEHQNKALQAKAEHGTVTVIHRSPPKTIVAAPAAPQIPQIVTGAAQHATITVVRHSAPKLVVGAVPAVAPPPAQVKIEMITPPPVPMPTYPPTPVPVMPTEKPKTVITTITDTTTVVHDNGVMSNTTSVSTTRDVASLITAAPSNASVPIVVSILTAVPQPKFVVNVVTDATPAPVLPPPVVTAAPTTAPTAEPVVPPTGSPSYPSGTYVLNLDVSGLPKDHGAVAVPVALPNGLQSVVNIPASQP